MHIPHQTWTEREHVKTAFVMHCIVIETDYPFFKLSKLGRCLDTPKTWTQSTTSCPCLADNITALNMKWDDILWCRDGVRLSETRKAKAMCRTASNTSVWNRI
jgi:hypothetical protein